MPTATHPVRRRSHSWSALALVALGLTAGACSNKKDDPGSSGGAAGAPAAKAAGKGGATTGACDRREREHLCSEYFGAAKPDWVKGQCDAQNAPFLPAGCPKEGAAGRCTRGAGTASRTDTLFYPPMTRETVTAMCTDGVVGDA